MFTASQRSVRIVLVTSAFVFGVALSVPAAYAQEIKETAAVTKDNTVAAEKDANATRTAKFADYKGVHIGMSVDEARQKSGKPKDKDSAQDLYVFSDAETVQVFYDDKHTVYAISVDYSGKNGSAPTPLDVFGQDVKPKPDGSIYQMQQYPDAGYWVSYSRSAGDSPLVTVTIQRLH